MLACPQCQEALPEQFFEAPNLQPCPICRTAVQVRVFPALLRPPVVGSTGEALLVPGESSCFYHEAKRAVVTCQSCGRFLCALCDVDLNDEHLCPACVQAGLRKGKLTTLENRRILYDSLALTLALMPLLIFYLTIFTAPAVLYVVPRYWNAPPSLVAPSRWRMIVALFFAVVEIAGWVLLLYFVFHFGFRSTGRK